MFFSKSRRAKGLRFASFLLTAAAAGFGVSQALTSSLVAAPRVVIEQPPERTLVSGLEPLSSESPVQENNDVLHMTMPNRLENSDPLPNFFNSAPFVISVGQKVVAFDTETGNETVVKVPVEVARVILSYYIQMHEENGSSRCIPRKK